MPKEARSRKITLQLEQRQPQRQGDLLVIEKNSTTEGEEEEDNFDDDGMATLARGSKSCHAFGDVKNLDVDKRLIISRHEEQTHVGNAVRHTVGWGEYATAGAKISRKGSWTKILL